MGEGLVLRTDYGRGYVSYETVFEDNAPTNNTVRVLFDETRRLTIMGDIVSLSIRDAKRLRDFIDEHVNLPDERH